MSVVNRCARCEKSVYPTEELKCLDKVWHKLCFKCQECGMTLNMKSYKGYNKLPYCNAHTPVAKHTTVADTPEARRLAENTKLQSQAKYHEEFERNIKGKATQLADDPELQRLKQSSKMISNVEYHREIEKKQDMENRRRLVENGIPSGDCDEQTEENHGGVLDQLNDVLSGMSLTNAHILQNSREIIPTSDPLSKSRGMPYQGKQDDHVHNMNHERVQQQMQQQQQFRNDAPRNGMDSHNIGKPYGVNTQAFPVSTSVPSPSPYQQQAPPMQGVRQNSQLLYAPQQQSRQPPMSHPSYTTQNNVVHPQYYGQDSAPAQQRVQQPPQHFRQPQATAGGYPSQTFSPPASAQVRAPQMMQQQQRPYYNQQHHLQQQQQQMQQQLMQQQQIQQQQMQQQQYYPPNGIQGGQQYAPQMPVSPPALQELRGKFQAIYDYKAQDHDEVSFLDGDLIENCFRIDEGWILGRVHRTGQRGMIPANYVEQL